MIQVLLVVIGAVLLIWFLIPVFSHRILNIGNTTGLGIGLVLLLCGLLFHPFHRFLAWLWCRLPGRIFEIVIGICIFAILVLAVMTMVCMGRGMTVYETKGQNETDSCRDCEQGKTVIILGCKVIGERPSLMLEERLEAAAAYLLEHPVSNVIVSGGQGKDEVIPEAEVMYSWLVQNGIEGGRILKEDRSTDTHENLQYCYEIINGLSNGKQTAVPEGFGTDVVIVTNEFHEYRALKIAKEAGFEACPLPAATAWWLFPTYYVREMYGILEDWFLK